jgi:hypothetical protein
VHYAHVIDADEKRSAAVLDLRHQHLDISSGCLGRGVGKGALAPCPPFSVVVGTPSGAHSHEPLEHSAGKKVLVATGAS